eukprot:TRINITY_DN12970_c1_g1_i1.p6 TRINITY_DN12970_c1_g1~~TRINITY_DN12970_c1_g1_i1.p6  ORF type:complete len:116 (-),score=5.41 TRINITY_DN12970_c1_g1_i1:108-455(-)
MGDVYLQRFKKLTNNFVKYLKIKQNQEYWYKLGWKYFNNNILIIYFQNEFIFKGNVIIILNAQKILRGIIFFLQQYECTYQCVMDNQCRIINLNYFLQKTLHGLFKNKKQKKNKK